MTIEFTQTEEHAVFTVTAAEGEVSDDRDEEIAQDEAAYEMAANAAVQKGYVAEDGVFEAGTDRSTRESGNGKEWELRFEI